MHVGGQRGAPFLRDVLPVLRAEDEQRFLALPDAFEEIAQCAVQVADAHGREEDPRLREMLADRRLLLRRVQPECVHPLDR